jgi:uncharacterized protein
MSFDNFTPGPALAGGALIGLAASWLLLAHGKIAGISGMYASLFDPRSAARPIALPFAVGLLAGGFGLRWLRPAAFASAAGLAQAPSLAVLALAGLVVGYGVRLGSGCTSGHGVCGISRFSARSLVATATFMLTGFATVFVTRHVFGGH